jgi:tetratricopeptide (TPR) repeat protein
MKTLFRSSRTSIAVLALGLCAALGFAQSPKPAPASAAQSKPATPAQKKLDAILERYDKAMKDWKQSLDAAKSQEEAEALYEKRPGDEFLDDLEAVAKEAKGTDTAAQAWTKYAMIANGLGNVKQVATAIDVLVQDHVTSPLLADVAEMLSSSPAFKPSKSEELLRRLIEKSPDKKVQAAAMFGLGSKLMGEKKPTPERTAEGRALLEKVKKDYTGIASGRGPEYAAMAGGHLFEIDNLQIGKAPPDFETIDENGVKFKLSDYRGKVVVIDFWGNW